MLFPALAPAAEGECQSKIAISTGQSRVTELRAKGVAEARVLIAKAEAEAVTAIGESLAQYGINPTHYLIGLRYLETLRAVSMNAASRRIFVPYETDIAGSLGNRVQ